MKLLTNKILIEDIIEEKKSDAGIIMSPATRSYNTVPSGQVIEIGPLAKVKVGDVLLYTPNAGYPLASSKQRIIEQEDILAIL